MEKSLILQRIRKGPPTRRVMRLPGTCATDSAYELQDFSDASMTFCSHEHELFVYAAKSILNSYRWGLHFYVRDGDTVLVRRCHIFKFVGVRTCRFLYYEIIHH